MTETNTNGIEEMVIERTIKTKLAVTGTGKDSPIHEITIGLDFTGVDLETLCTWAAKDRVIVFQNNNRKHMKVEEYLKMNGTTVHVDKLCKGAGRSVVTRPMTPEEQIAYVKSLPEDERADYMEKLMEMMTS